MPSLPALTSRLLLLGAFVQPALAGDDVLIALTGCHQGDVFDGTEHLPVTTRFERSDDSASGSYTFAYQGAIEHGELSGCRAETGRHVHCRWSDRFGSGDLNLQVDAKGEGFRGSWSADGYDSSLDWNGRRIACIDGPE